MDVIKSTFYPLLLELIKWTIVSVYWFFGYGGSWSQNTFYTLSIGLGSMALYLLINFILKIKRPLSIEITLDNPVSGKNTNFYASGRRCREAERIVQVKISIKKKPSIWSSLGFRILKGKKCVVFFDTLPKSEFVLEPDLTRIVENCEYGFELCLNDIIEQLLGETDGEIKRTIEFVILNSRDACINNRYECDIKPKYLINGKPIGLLHSLIYDVSIEKHKICYFDKYMGLNDRDLGGE